jgi:hypothetical protein
MMARRTSKSKKSNPGLLPAPASGVTVRMYNPGFGDCLLLAFRADDGSPRYLLIDCGAHHRYPDRKTRLQKIAKDIATSTNSHLHIVAATHEHTDHLDGFRLASDTFATIQIDDLWLAWTEDPDDPVANELRQRYDKHIRAMFGAVSQLQAAGQPNADSLGALMDFEYSHSPRLGVAGADGADSGNEAPIPFLRDRSTRKLVRSGDYLRPGQPPLTLPGVKGIQIYVFGPPKTPSMLRLLERNSELYPEIAAASEADAFTAAVVAADTTTPISPDDKDAFESSRPFNDLYRIDLKDAPQNPEYGHFFTGYYGSSASDDPNISWRRIDSDWLGAGENMALSINSYTNNTSLVLAVEITDSQPRKVLLFAADAQTGNWLSWQDLSWPGAGPAGEKVTADDLLERIVLYKVGHHGSRNATLSQKGLELMDQPGLVAMIPVDQKWAMEAMHWEHPAEKLLARLEVKASGRVIRTDQIPAGGQPPAQPAGLPEAEWKNFLQHLTWDISADALWIQFTVPA